MKVLPRPNLLPNEHTGKLRAHHHTCYPLLAFSLVVVALTLGALSLAATADATSFQTASNYSVSATVPSKPPASPGVITDPLGGNHYSYGSITVVGSCPSDTLVKIFRNNIFGGAVFCDLQGTFSLPVSLFRGRDDLTVGVYNAVNAAGPASKITTVYYDGPAGVGRAANQLTINSSNTYVGICAGGTLGWPIEIIGGTPPYMVSVDWGDGSSDTLSKADSGSLTLNHTYTKAGVGARGSYNIIAKVTDAAGNQSGVHLTTIVGDDKTRTGPVILSDSSGLALAWPLLAVTSPLVFSFAMIKRKAARAAQATQTAQTTQTTKETEYNESF